MSVLSRVGILSGVQYIIFGPLVMHVRFVAAAVDATRSLASMFGPPDGDMYEEDFAEQRDLRQTATATDRQTVPGSAAARMGAVGVVAPVGRGPAGPVAPPVGASVAPAGALVPAAPAPPCMPALHSLGRWLVAAAEAGVNGGNEVPASLVVAGPG